LGPLSPQYIVQSDGIGIVKENIDKINNEIVELHNLDELILDTIGK
jgi:hypothetical protein